MARNMKEANGTVFTLLDQYSAGRDQPIPNAGCPRWIATVPTDRKFLKNATVSKHVHFAPRRKLGRFEWESNTYFCCTGFDYAEPVVSLTEVEPNAAMMTAILAELRPRPIATPLEIVQNVGGADRTSDSAYQGHPIELIEPLFPRIRVFAASNLSDDETWYTIFKLCLSECVRGDGWINDRLTSTLGDVCELSGLSLPYETLCRSVFDMDPSAMFLALYRCIEAIYAYSGSQSVIKALGIAHRWADVAIVLEEQIGWHAREDAALAALMKHAAEHDLQCLFTGLGEAAPDDSAGLSVAAAKRLYALRNGLVHFRPSQSRADYTAVDWNVVCEAVACMVCHIYAEVFPI